MLGRAVVPLLRHRIYPPAVRLTISNLQVRQYAKVRPAPESSYRPPASAPLEPWQRQPGMQDRSPRTLGSLRHESKTPDYSGNQPEFDTAGNSQKNEAVDSASVRSRRRFDKIDQDTSNATNSTTQPDSQPDFESHTNQNKPIEGESSHQKEPDRLMEEEEVQFDPKQPLPDLTQGIPSTLDAELQQARSRQEASHASFNITEDPSESQSSGGAHGSGRLPKSTYVSSNERKKNALFRWAYAFIALGVGGYIIYLGRNWETKEEASKHPDVPSGWGIRLFYNRVKARLASTLDYYNEPAFPKLLPKHDPNMQPPMCLVLSLEDLLVHQEWTRERGWRIAKRPGVDYFLRYLSQYYELVLFTTQPSSMADQVIRKLDPYRIINWPLFREATLYKDGGYIKDLSYLNRDLSKVILIDTDPHHAKNQPENAIIVPKWTGDPNDQTLVQFIPFLEYVATMGFDDSRAVLKSFEGKYIPAEFARREKLLREKFEAKMAEERKKRPKRTVGGIGSLFGVKGQPSPDGLENSAEAFEQGKMLWDQIRERGQKNYQVIDKQIREEGQKWLDELLAEEKRFQEEQMKSMKSGFWKFFSWGSSAAREGEGEKK